MKTVRLVLALLIAFSFSAGAFAAIGSSIAPADQAAALEHCNSNPPDQACNSMPGKAPETKACLDMTGCAAGSVWALPSRSVTMNTTRVAKPVETPEEPHPSGRAVAPDIPIPLI
jgi:hypothetical protein